MSLFNIIKKPFVSAPATETETESVSVVNWQMAGSEGTNEYIVPFRSHAGCVGFRLLFSGAVRIRVEPTGEDAVVALAPSFLVGEWKQPDLHQFRFSCVISAGEAEEVMDSALNALFEAADGGGIEYNKPVVKAKWRSKIRAHHKA